LLNLAIHANELAFKCADGISGASPNPPALAWCQHPRKQAYRQAL
jgi:hypothetical protein